MISARPAEGFLQCYFALVGHENDGTEVFVGRDVLLDGFAQMLQAVGIKTFYCCCHGLSWSG